MSYRDSHIDNIVTILRIFFDFSCKEQLRFNLINTININHFFDEENDMNQTEERIFSKSYKLGGSFIIDLKEEIEKVIEKGEIKSDIKPIEASLGIWELSLDYVLL